MNIFNPIWTGLFAHLKRLVGGGGAFWPTSLLGYFKSEDDETWYGYTMGRDLYKLTKPFDDVNVMLIL